MARATKAALAASVSSHYWCNFFNGSVTWSDPQWAAQTAARSTSIQKNKLIIFSISFALGFELETFTVKLLTAKTYVGIRLKGNQRLKRKSKPTEAIAYS